MPTNADRAAAQYATTARLCARIALHRFGVNPVPWQEWLAARLPLRPGIRILEVGAGTGALWSAVDPTGFDLTLTDAAPAMVAALAARFPTATVRAANAEALPFPDGSFDGAIANHMLYHLDSPATGLRELARVLRPGGWLGAATNGHHHMIELTEAAVAAGLPTAGRSLSGYVAESAPDLLAAEFTDITVVPYEDHLEVPIADLAVAYAASWTDRDLTAAELTPLREHIQAIIDRTGHFRISKHTVLVTALR